MLNRTQGNGNKKNLFIYLLNQADGCIEKRLTSLSYFFGTQPNRIFSVIVGLALGLIIGLLL